MSGQVSNGRRRRRWSATQILDELATFGVVAGVLAATVSQIVPALGVVTIPALASVVAGVAVRVLRIRPELDGVSKQVDRAVAGLSDQLGELRQAVVSPDLHEAEKCTRPRFYQHMLAALEGAEHTVELTQLDTHAPQHYGTPAMVAYFKRVKEIVAERPYVQFRRIVAIPTLAKLAWLIDVLEANADRPNFQINVIDLPPRHQPAPLSLQIFDCKELCMVDPTVGSMQPGEQENMLWIAGSGVAEVFAIYYRDLWSKSTPLKEGLVIHPKVLQDILVKLRQQEPRERELAVELGSRIRALAARQSPLARAG